MSAAAVSRGGADYRLGAGDLLKISTFGYADLTADVRVSESGNITFPLIGQVAAEGLSTRELENLIIERLARGKIHRAGAGVGAHRRIPEPEGFRHGAGRQARPVFPRWHDQSARPARQGRRRHRGFRRRSRPCCCGATARSQPIDLEALFRGDASQNPVVADGDTINVLRAPRFYIYGEVQKPGAYRLERNMTLSRAITAGGGLTARGSERRAVVKRRDAAGSRTQRVDSRRRAGARRRRAVRQGESVLTLAQLLRVLRARRALVIAVLVAIVVLVTGVSLLLPETYVARVTLVADMKDTDPVTGNAVRSQLLTSYLNTQADIVMSRNVALKVVDRYRSPTTARCRAEFHERAQAGGELREWLADRLLGNLEVELSRNSNVFRIAYSALDAGDAALVANAFAEAYIQTTIELKLDPARRQSRWFDEQLLGLRSALEEKQQRLADFQRKNTLVTTDGRLDVETARLAGIAAEAARRADRHVRCADAPRTR